MKVICKINSIYVYEFGSPVHHPITVGKIYDVIPNQASSEYTICCDDGKNRFIPKFWFITLEEHRSKQLDKILN